MSFKMDRKQYSQMFGPTVGDSVRLGDTNLYAAIEKRPNSPRPRKQIWWR